MNEDKLVKGVRFEFKERVGKDFYLYECRQNTIIYNGAAYCPDLGLVTHVAAGVQNTQVGDIISFPIPGRSASVVFENSDKDLDGNFKAENTFTIEEDAIMAIVRSAK